MRPPQLGKFLPLPERWLDDPSEFQRCNARVPIHAPVVFDDAQKAVILRHVEHLATDPSETHRRRKSLLSAPVFDEDATARFVRLSEVVLDRQPASLSSSHPPSSHR